MALAIPGSHVNDMALAIPDFRYDDMNSLETTSTTENKIEETTEFTHEEDSWLFSSEKKTEEDVATGNVTAVDSVEDLVEISSHDFTESINKEEGEKSDEDDDEIDVRIDQIDASSASHSNIIRGNQNQFQKSQNKGVDLEAPGNINGVTTYDYDLNQIKDEDKPWRKPGADITDYFNYGFNEETWMLYCLKQRRLRAENSQYSSQKPNLVSNPSLVAQIFKTKTITNAKRLPASIDVIGTTDQTSRRQNGSFDDSTSFSIQPPIHPVMPDLSTPPPGYQCPPGIISPAVGSRSIPPVRHPVQQFFPLPVPRMHERPPAPQSYAYPFPRPPQAYTMWENPNAEHFRYDNARSRSRSSSNPRSKNGRSDSLDRRHDSHSRRGGSGDERESRYRSRRSRDRPSTRYNDHSSSRNRDDRGSSRSDRRSRRSRDDSRRRRHRDDDRHSHRRHDRRRKKSYHSDDSEDKKKSSKKSSKRSKWRTKSKERRSSRASSSTTEKRTEKSVEPKSVPPED